MRLESSVTPRILIVSENCSAESAILTEVRKDMVFRRWAFKFKFEAVHFPDDVSLSSSNR